MISQVIFNLIDGFAEETKRDVVVLHQKNTLAQQQLITFNIMFCR